VSYKFRIRTVQKTRERQIDENLSTTTSEEIIDLKAANKELIGIEKKAANVAERHNQFLISHRWTVPDASLFGTTALHP
jgi:hypothetical protein